MLGTKPFPSDQLGSGLVTLYDSHDGNEGHRPEYYALFARLLGARRTASFAKALLSPRPVLVGALEASVPRYFLLAALRALLGKRTAGILFRPVPVLDPREFRLRFKRGALRWLLRCPGVTTLTLLPFDIEPRFAEVARDWIYDPQFWDLSFAAPQNGIGNGYGELAGKITGAAHDRRLCCAIGRQDRSKGFDRFVQLYDAREDIRADWLFAFAGSVSPDCADDCQRFVDCGGHAHAHYVAISDLLDLYAVSDVIWCSYASDYDQASGVFGRAMQAGVPVVVRSGSLLERFCLAEGLPFVSYDGNPAAFDPGAVPRRRGSDAARTRAMGEQSLARLRTVLGLD